MNNYYFDTSAIVKRYAIESGSEWVVNITDTIENTILLSEIAIVEFAAAISAKERAPDGISIQERNNALSLFIQECRDRYIILVFNHETIDLAVDLCLYHPLRAYDAIQLATAILANNELIKEHHTSLTFVSADNNLLNAAQKEGLPVENPNLYS